METKPEKNYFKILDAIDIAGHVEQKNNLSYLSWAWCWKMVKENYPDANYKIYERDTEFGPVNYFTDGFTCWVKTEVTINGISHVEMLPVMDYKNRSIYLQDITSFDVNKAIQRSLTKACARHGLGLRLYSGEDLPDSEAEAKLRAENAAKATPKKTAGTKTTKTVTPVVENELGEVSNDNQSPKPTLKELITNIGNLIKTGAVQVADYKAIVKGITGIDNFLVNKSTEDDYETVLSIYNKLIGK